MWHDNHTLVILVIVLLFVIGVLANFGLFRLYKSKKKNAIKILLLIILTPVIVFYSLGLIIVSIVGLQSTIKTTQQAEEQAREQAKLSSFSPIEKTVYFKQLGEKRRIGHLCSIANEIDDEYSSINSIIDRQIKSRLKYPSSFERAGFDKVDIDSYWDVKSFRKDSNLDKAKQEIAFGLLLSKAHVYLENDTSLRVLVIYNAENVFHKMVTNYAKFIASSDSSARIIDYGIVCSNGTTKSHSAINDTEAVEWLSAEKKK